MRIFSPHPSQNPGSKANKEEVKKFFTSTKPVEMLLLISDYTFMFSSYLLFMLLFVMSLNNLKYGFPNTILSMSTIFIGILFFIVGKHLQKNRKRRIQNKHISTWNRLNKATERYLPYCIYFVYAISLSYIIHTFFSFEMSQQYSELKDGLSEISQMYYWLIIFFIILFLLMVILTLIFYVLSLLPNNDKLIKVVLSIILFLIIIGFHLLSQINILNQINIEKADKLTSVLVGPLVMYLIRLLFFRKWISFPE